tara:strand:- start:22325 stop:23407 length:1083 start_codon:yes stop_codon:yes gene_type:complete
MKKTSLYDKHIKNDAKMIPFSGFVMPIQYEGINIEHNHVRNNVGLFDVSHMGEFFIKGKKTTELLNLICTNKINEIPVGKAQYNCFTNNNGGIIDDLIVYKLDESEYMLVVNAANIDKDWNWINKQNKKFGNQIENKSDSMSLLALQGPSSHKLLQKIVDFELVNMKNYSVVRSNIKSFENVIISTTGYTGSGGFEIYCNNKDANGIWDLLFQNGEEFNLKPIGLAARDTLRLEMGYCLYGNDINENTNPIEANLKWITNLEKNFIGCKAIKNSIQLGIKKKLVGFKMIDRGIPRKNYKIFNNDEIIGEVCSGTMSPTLKIGIGLGYIQTNYSNLNSEIKIEIRNKMVSAKIVKTPFIEI